MMQNRMTFIGACFVGASLLAATTSAQLPAAGDRDPSGRVYAKVVVTITGESGAFGQPASGLRFLVVAENGDRVSIRTNDAGVASTWLFPGSYRFVTPDPFSWDGNAYTWDAVVAIRAGTGTIRLSQANASKIVALAGDPSAPGRTETRPSRPAQSALPGQGFHLGIALNGSSIQIDDTDLGRGDAESGGGLNFDLGYNFKSKFGVLLTLAAANVSGFEADYTLAQADLAGRYSFANPARAFVPYVEAGFTGLSAIFSDVDLELQGAGITGAVGFDYFFAPRVALDLNFRYTKGEINTLKSGGISISNENGVGFNAGRFNIGLSIFPGAR